MATSSELADWLERLVTADPADRRMVAIEGMAAGIGYARVRCVRHKARLNWQSAFAHLDRTEATHRLQHGPATRLHEVGDLRAATAEEQPFRSRWATSTCRSAKCRRLIVWARTPAGGRIPVDARPDPSGNVLLSALPGGSPTDAPVATMLHSDAQRAEVELAALHTTHFQTCPDAPAWRRP